MEDVYKRQVKELLVVNLIDLVHEHDNVRHTDLTGEQNVLTGLGHGAVSRGNNQNSAVHLSSAGNHILDVVSICLLYASRCV